MCGQCVLHSTGPTCPMNCPKRCATAVRRRARRRRCEVKPEMRCVWLKARALARRRGARPAPAGRQPALGHVVLAHIVTKRDKQLPEGWRVRSRTPRVGFVVTAELQRRRGRLDAVGALRAYEDTSTRSTRPTTRRARAARGRVALRSSDGAVMQLVSRPEPARAARHRSARTGRDLLPRDDCRRADRPTSRPRRRWSRRSPPIATAYLSGRPIDPRRSSSSARSRTRALRRRVPRRARVKMGSAGARFLQLQVCFELPRARRASWREAVAGHAAQVRRSSCRSASSLARSCAAWTRRCWDHSARDDRDAASPPPIPDGMLRAAVADDSPSSPRSRASPACT